MDTTPHGITLKKVHARRLREIYRSAGWPCLDIVEIELLAAGLLAKKAVDRVRDSGANVNSTLKRVAAKAGVEFVDMFAASEGHDVCSSDPWVNGFRTVAGEAYYFHPFPAYHEAVAAKLAALLAG